MPVPLTSDASLPPLALEPTKAARLEELAQSLQARAKRMASDIYWQGQDLLEAKALFGRGQNQAFLDWAKQSAQVQTTLIYRFMQVAQSFPEFSDQDFEVVATALYAIASPSTPRPARAEFLQRSRLGEVVSLPAAKAIVERYSGHQDEQFERYRKLVLPWGTLQRSHEDKLQLLTLEGETKTFHHYTDLKQAFLDWRKETFITDLQTVQTLMSPHWNIRPCPIPSQPFRLEMTCQLPGLDKALVVKNPRVLIEWWHRQGQELSDRLATNAADTQPKQLLADLQPSQFSTLTCRNCSWREETVAVGKEEFWCGFYRTAFGLDQAEVRPQICRKWQPLEQLSSVEGELEISTFSPRSPQVFPVARSLSTRFLSPTVPPARSVAEGQGLSDLLQQIESLIEPLTADELELVQQAIDRRRNAVLSAAHSQPVKIASPV